MRAQRELIDAAVGFPLCQAPPKIAPQARSGLVPLLGVLGEELHDDGRKRAGDFGAFAGRCRLARNMAMDPLQGIGGGKRKSAREHLVQGDAQRVEIAARIDRAVHPAGLLGRHVGERAGNDLRRRGHLALLRQPRRDPESGEPDVAGVIDEDVRGLDVLVDEAVPVDLAKRRRQSNGNAQEPSQLERLPAVEDAIEELASRVLEYEHRSPFVARECQRPGCPCGIEVGGEQVFMLEPPEALRLRLFCGGRYREERKGIAVLPATVKGELRTFPQNLQHISGTCCHGPPAAHGKTIPIMHPTLYDGSSLVSTTSTSLRGYPRCTRAKLRWYWTFAEKKSISKASAITTTTSKALERSRRGDHETLCSTEVQVRCSHDCDGHRRSRIVTFVSARVAASRRRCIKGGRGDRAEAQRGCAESADRHQLSIGSGCFGRRSHIRRRSEHAGAGTAGRVVRTVCDGQHTRNRYPTTQLLWRSRSRLYRRW